MFLEHLGDNDDVVEVSIDVRLQLRPKYLVYEPLEGSGISPV